MSIVFPSAVFPQLKTDRLVLRELVPADSEQLLAIRSNEAISRFIGRSNQQTMEAINQFIRARNEDRLNGKGVYWAIQLKNTPGVIGTICCWNFDYDAATAEIGYELLPTYQGSGLMGEAIKKVIAFGFKDMQLKTITAWPMPQNEPSVKLLERNGFTYSETVDGQLVYKLNNTGVLNNSQ
ncbi:GNAT family N-acetyltransferase [Mucilaginibacter ginsenosidivorax]|uniref:GNAT family N-acetyltransferase n=1 Tax=Mucilaginibacter ginsenosidivorax TaxID=862126 RepID=A0A5B8W890_9SPHI|nr:GNAT family N-acetyltransferase [Mucilaginibacter ginsenosidivorax]QEC79176.1 GNAT family N-acetyltransferase [Mucilaginibacter ginsenosidivorax]